jgi:hypothetical protein
MKKIASTIALAWVCAPALALDKMPDEPGLSGFVNAGVSTGSIESNMLAKVGTIDLDLGDDTIDDFGSPDDESITTFALNLTLNYTFSNLKTQVSLGNDLADFLQFDRSTILSLRHDFDSLGRVQASVLSSAFPQTEVWEDPYVLGEKRKETERDSTGGRLTWDKIFGTQFELKVQQRKVELDHERSGEALGLSRSQRLLLDREGDVFRSELGYMFNIDNGTHLIRPSVAFIDRDLDGDAMAQDGYEGAVSYVYRKGDITWANTLSYSSLEAGRENPIFEEDHDSEQVTFATQVFVSGLFGLENWMPNIALMYGESDSDIDFYDAKGWMVNVAMGRQF